MAQLIESSFICDGRFRLLTIQPMGRKIGRIIEIEEVDTRERIHGTARRLDRLALALRRSLPRRTQWRLSVCRSHCRQKVDSSLTAARF